MGPRSNRRVDRVVRAWALGIAVSLAIFVSPADAREVAEPETHCVVGLVGEGSEVVALGCHSTRAAALGSALQAGATSSRASSSVLGVHFTGQSFTGSSITVTGSGCTGLIWQPSGSWNNNIESSYHYCGGSATRFYDSSSCSGTSKSIFSAATSLMWMNNRTSCVRYG